MFDLEKEVEKWVQSKVGSSCFEGALREEIRDHLYCEIEKNMAEGLKEESAFYAATRRLGLTEDFTKEFDSASENACETVLRSTRGLSLKQLALFNAIFLVVFAVLVFGTAIGLNGTPYEKYIGPASWVLMFVPLILALNHRRNNEECRAIKRFFTRR